MLHDILIRQVGDEPVSEDIMPTGFCGSLEEVLAGDPQLERGYPGTFDGGACHRYVRVVADTMEEALEKAKSIRLVCC